MASLKEHIDVWYKYVKADIKETEDRVEETEDKIDDINEKEEFPIDNELPEVESEVNIVVLDMTGRKVFERNYSNTNEIQMNLDANSGVYLVTVKVGNQTSTQRLIRQ